VIYVRQEDTGVATPAVHEQAMLTICTETLDSPVLKENTAKFMLLLISSSPHIFLLQGSLTQHSEPELCAGKGQPPIMMSVMQEGNASVSKQPITWGGKREEGVTVALRVAILGGGRGLSRPMPLCTQNLPW